MPIDQVGKFIALSVKVRNWHTQFSCDVPHRQQVRPMNARFISVDPRVRSGLVKTNTDTKLSLRQRSRKPGSSEPCSPLLI